jgi:hypothetical protein
MWTPLALWVGVMGEDMLLKFLKQKRVVIVVEQQ